MIAVNDGYFAPTQVNNDTASVRYVIFPAVRILSLISHIGVTPIPNEKKYFQNGIHSCC